MDGVGLHLDPKRFIDGNAGGSFPLRPPVVNTTTTAHHSGWNVWCHCAAAAASSSFREDARKGILIVVGLFQHNACWFAPWFVVGPILSLAIGTTIVHRSTAGTTQQFAIGSLLGPTCRTHHLHGSGSPGFGGVFAHHPNGSALNQVGTLLKGHVAGSQTCRIGHVERSVVFFCKETWPHRSSCSSRPLAAQPIPNDRVGPPGYNPHMQRRLPDGSQRTRLVLAMQKSNNLITPVVRSKPTLSCFKSRYINFRQCKYSNARAIGSNVRILSNKHSVCATGVLLDSTGRITTTADSRRC